MHEKKYEEEIIKRLEFLCPNARQYPRLKSEEEAKNFQAVESARLHYSAIHPFLIEDEFKEKKWTPIPESKEDLIYLAALNSVIEKTTD